MTATLTRSLGGSFFSAAGRVPARVTAAERPAVWRRKRRRVRREDMGPPRVGAGVGAWCDYGAARGGSKPARGRPGPASRLPRRRPDAAQVAVVGHQQELPLAVAVHVREDGVPPAAGGERPEEA